VTFKLVVDYDGYIQLKRVTQNTNSETAIATSMHVGMATHGQDPTHLASEWRYMANGDAIPSVPPHAYTSGYTTLLNISPSPSSLDGHSFYVFGAMSGGSGYPYKNSVRWSYENPFNMRDLSPFPFWVASFTPWTT